MTITFYGENCFKIQSGDFTVLTDPFDVKIGLTPPRLKPDVILKTLTLFPIANQLIGQQTHQLIHGPGEYNIKDINITGFGLPLEQAKSPASAKTTAGKSEKLIKTIYLIKIENINLCFLGHLSEMLEPIILEHLEEIDILFIPAGGEPFIDQKSAVKLIKQIEPKIIIPTFFKIPGLKRTTADLKIFLEEFGYKEKIEPQEKLTIKKKDLAEIKKTEIIILKT